MTTLLGPERVFTTANREFVEFLAGREILGRRVIDMLPEIEAQGIIPILDDVDRAGESSASKEQSRASRGEGVHIDHTCCPPENGQ